MKYKTLADRGGCRMENSKKLKLKHLATQELRVLALYLFSRLSENKREEAICYLCEKKDRQEKK